MYVAGAFATVTESSTVVQPAMEGGSSRSSLRTLTGFYPYWLIVGRSFAYSSASLRRFRMSGIASPAFIARQSCWLKS